MNEVEAKQRKIASLEEEIKTIQDMCKHTFEEVECLLAESLISGAYIGYVAGPVRLADGEARPAPAYDFLPSSLRGTCKKCNFQLKGSILHTCPKCLSDVRPIGMAPGGRVRYFGCDYSYYGIMLSSCTNPECSFQVATDEWDQ